MINFSKKILILLILAGFILPVPYLVYGQQSNDQQNNNSGYDYNPDDYAVDTSDGSDSSGGGHTADVNVVDAIKTSFVGRTVATVWGYGSNWVERGGGISGTYALMGTISLDVANGLFNQVVYISVVKFSDIYQGSSSSINNAWKIGRDLANFFFIFILLYIAISTILDRVDWKKLLVRVIIIALLVNFSAVIPKVMIDASNILALSFYDNIGKQSSNQPHDLTAAFLNKVVPTPDHPILDITWGSILNLVSGNIFNLNNWLDGTMMFILFYILLVASILFIIRIGVLIMLIILSPLAFIGWIIPSAGTYSNQWWQKLLSESIFAPAFMFILYAVVILVGGKDANGQPTVSLLDTVSKISSSTQIAALINFFIIVTFLTAALMIARKFSSTGAGIAIGWADKVKKLAFGGVALGAGAAGAYTLGKAARAAIKSDTFQKFATRNPFVGNLAQAGLSGVAKKKFAGATSYEDRVERTASRIEDFKTSESRSQYLNNLGEIDRKAAYNKLTDRQKAELHEHITTSTAITPQQKIELDKLAPKVGTENYEKMEAEREKVRNNQNIKNALTLINPPAPAAGGPPPVPTTVDIQTALGNLKGKNINKLEPSNLIRSNVAEHLTIRHLAAIKDHPTMDDSQKTAIRNIITAAATGPTPTPTQTAALAWLNGPGGQDF